MHTLSRDIATAFTDAFSNIINDNLTEYGLMILDYIEVTHCTDEEAIEAFVQALICSLEDIEVPFTMTITTTEVQE